MHGCNILAWLEHVAELQRSQYLLVLESLYGSISWHDLHFEREKDLVRTFSGAVGRFHFQTVMTHYESRSTWPNVTYPITYSL